jgi:hypothetical protein
MLVIGILRRLEERSEFHRSSVVNQDIESAAKLATKDFIDRPEKRIGAFDGAQIGLNTLCIATRLLISDTTTSARAGLAA